jgi:hypothetical protein
MSKSGSHENNAGGGASPTPKGGTINVEGSLYSCVDNTGFDLNADSLVLPQSDQR